MPNLGLHCKTKTYAQRKQPLEEYKVNIRIVLSAFWTAIMFCYLYGDYFELYVPNKVAGLISGDNLLTAPRNCS
jgi:hypothetical protein